MLTWFAILRLVKIQLSMLLFGSNVPPQLESRNEVKMKIVYIFLLVLSDIVYKICVQLLLERKDNKQNFSLEVKR